MIQNPLFLALGLIALVAGILKLEKTRALRVVFHYLPAPFWCYFIPVSLASAGLLPPSSPVYTFLSSYVLGACLILLLLSVNLPLIGRVGPVALGAMAAAYRSIGLPPVVIVGGSSLIGLLMWTLTYLKKPVEPRIILPPFLLTVAGLELHMAEEYASGFGPAMSRLFDRIFRNHHRSNLVPL